MIFYYKAKKGPDQTIEGEIAAESKSDAMSRLEEMGLAPVRVDAVPHNLNVKKQYFGRVTFRDVTVFTRQLASLIRAGVPILRSLSIVKEQTDKVIFKKVLEEITERVRDGNPVSFAMGFYPRLFSPIYVNLIRAGELAGKLDVVLDNLANSREKEEDIRRRFQAAMAYPALVLLVGIITVFILLVFFMPQLIDLYRDFKTLPLPTQVLISVSNFFQQTWHWIVMVIFLVFMVLHRLASMEKGQSVITALILKVPVMRRFVLETEMARFSRTLSLLLESGINIERALELSGDVFRSAFFKNELANITNKTIKHGVPFSEGLKRSSIFPPFVGNMIAVGEGSGQLDKSLLEIAEFYEKNIEYLGRTIVSLVEPILILGIGAIVGFIVAAMLLPVFELGTGL